jgi:hypothetical protein
MMVASLEKVSRIGILAYPTGSKRMCPSRTDHLYSTEALEIMCQALENACRRALAKRRSLDETQQSALRAELGRIILDAYVEGEHDPEMLTHLALVRLVHEH